MPAEIHKQVLDYQGGDANAALELVEKFKPLIKRYAFFLHREDSFEDLQRFLLSMLKTWDTSRLSSTDDATVTRYIANSVKNEYIALSKQKAKERGTSYLEDATLPQALEYAQKTSTCDQYDQLTLQDLHKVLNEYEFAIVYAPCRSFVSSTGRIFVHCILMAVQYSIVRVCLIAIASLDIPTSIRDFHFIDRIGIKGRCHRI